MQTKNKRMVKVLSASALALGLISAATMAQAAAGIANTRHNLGTANRTSGGVTFTTGSQGARDGDLHTTGTDEICVFCHTPHGSAVPGVVNAPLWNKGAPATSNYTVYTSGTMQGTAGVAAGSMSLACLSCHDGTQAMDNMINSPGASGYVVGGARGGNAVNGVAVTGDWVAGTASAEGADVVSGAMQSTAGVVMLGTDLSNDHPIGMAYCGGGQTNTASNAGCNDGDFNAQTGVAVNGGSFYVGSSGVQRENMRTYGNSTATATVECGSCHDPHNAVNKTFLRTNNANSGVCLTCHVK